MIALVTSADSTGASSRRARAVSGRKIGSVASLAPGAVAHSPVKASSPSPSADSDTAGSGRASGLDFECPDEHAHQRLDPAAGDRRLGEPGDLRFGGI